MPIVTHISTTADGSMKSPDRNFASVLPVRTAFLQKHEIEADATTLVQVTYEGNDYCRFRTLTNDDKGDGITRAATIEADALVVTKPNHALFLPLADCVGAVMHDTAQNILMLSHLGRHNLEQLGGTKCIEYLQQTFGVDPSDLTVWLSPAAGKDNYPLRAFDGRGMHDVASEQLMTAGVQPHNITTSPIDVTTDENYFSHSQFLAGHRESDGRFAIVAALSPAT